MKTLALISLLVAAGCIDSSADAPSQRGPALPSNAYLIYDNVDQCLAENPDPRSCSFALALCSNGRAGVRVGDIVDDGWYEMIDGPLASGEIGGTAFTINVDTGAATGLVLDHWIPDTQGRWNTLQFDTIDCSQPQ